MLAIFWMQVRRIRTFSPQRDNHSLLEDSQSHPGTCPRLVPGREVREHAGSCCWCLQCLEAHMRLVMAVTGIALFVAVAVVLPCLIQAGEGPSPSNYTLLSPIRSGNLTVF